MDRMTSDRAAARRVIDRLRAERAAASDPLPARQQREARIVDATEAATQSAARPSTQGEHPDNVAAAIARALAKHRAVADKATETAAKSASETTSNSAPKSTQDVQDQKKETTVSEDKDPAARQGNPGKSFSQRQADLIQGRKGVCTIFGVIPIKEEPNE